MDITFFILAALQLTRQPVIDVSLPISSSSTTQTRDMWIVKLDAAGEISVRTEDSFQPVALDELDEVFARYPRLANLIVLYADENVIYNDVLELLDKLREMGGARVALATRTTSKGNNPPETTTPNNPSPAPDIQLPSPPQQ